jgi:hypothetical protein
LTKRRNVWSYKKYSKNLNPLNGWGQASGRKAEQEPTFYGTLRAMGEAEIVARQNEKAPQSTASDESRSGA